LENVEEAEVSIERDGIERLLTDHSWRCLDPALFNCRNQGISWAVGGVCRTTARLLGIEPATGWIKPVERACSVLRSDDIDVILASGAPFTSFEIAKRLSDKLGRPYVLDYRDPWTGNPHDGRPALSTVVRKEAKLLSDCAAVTIVSPSWASAMDRQFGIGPKLHVITNGYDPEELTSVNPYDFGHFAIVYTGTFYPPKRVITPVMAALKKLKQSDNGSSDWYFHYYGEHMQHVREEANRFSVSERVVLHGVVSRDEALSAVRGAGIAVVISSVGEDAEPQDRGIVPGKVFENIGLERPTLLIAPGNTDIEAVTATSGGAQRLAGSDIDGIATFLAAARHGAPPLFKDRETFAWPNLSKQFDSLLRTVTGHSVGSPAARLGAHPESHV
jgi:glycosyltransferase involved in cell wall biosynthesis